jgi:hypothetical protein
VQHLHPLLRRQVVETAPPFTQLLLLLLRQHTESGIVLQFPILLFGGQILVIAQPFAAPGFLAVVVLWELPRSLLSRGLLAGIAPPGTHLRTGSAGGQSQRQQQNEIAPHCLLLLQTLWVRTLGILINGHVIH